MKCATKRRKKSPVLEVELMTNAEVFEKYAGVLPEKIIISDSPCLYWDTKEKKLIPNFYDRFSIIDNTIVPNPNLLLTFVDSYETIDSHELNQYNYIVVYKHNHETYRYKICDNLTIMKKETRRPADCIDTVQALELKEGNGLGFNDFSIKVEPNVVILKSTYASMKIPMVHFKRFAEWYLEPQGITKQKE